MNAYISHSIPDRLLARRLASALKTDGVDAFDLYAEVLPGDNWAEKASQALQRAGAMVLLLTRNSIDDPTLAFDLGYALGNQRFRGRLFPVIAPDVSAAEVPWILNRFRALPLRSEDPDDAILSEISGAIVDAAQSGTSGDLEHPSLNRTQL